MQPRTLPATLGLVKLAARVEAIVAQPVVALDELVDAGGYSPALRLIATLADGSTVFVKAAVDDLTGQWVQAERAAYEALVGVSFMPKLVGADEETLVLEDLRNARWPPPWQAGDIDSVLAVLEEMTAIAAPDWAPALNDVRGDLGGLWDVVGADPSGLLKLGVCSPDWFGRAQPVLADAARRAPLDGPSVVHFDVRSDNVCLTPNGALLVDWNLLCRGNGAIDRAFFAQTLTMEGQGPPWELLPDADPGIVAVVAGFLADRAPGPPLPNAPRVRPVQLAQLRICLPWAARVLGLPEPS